MRQSPFTDLKPLGQGAGTLFRHPWWSLILVVIMAGLSMLGPAFQLTGKVPTTPLASLLLAGVALIPMELYFIPRFLLFLDAEALDHPLNPRAEWKATFENRWMRAFLAKAILYFVVFATSSTCLVAVGVLFLAIVGWAPYRVLLRGEGILEAYKGSALMMARLWPRALAPVSVSIGVCLSALLGLSLLQDRLLPDPVPPLLQITHPLVWGSDLVLGCFSLWMSTSMLALFHRLEASAPEAPQR